MPILLEIIFIMPLSAFILLLGYYCYKKMKLFGLIYLATLLGALVSFGLSIFTYINISSQARPGHALETLNNDYPSISILCDLAFFVLFLIVEAVRRHRYKDFGSGKED